MRSCHSRVLPELKQGKPILLELSRYIRGAGKVIPSEQVGQPIASPPDANVGAESAEPFQWGERSRHRDADMPHRASGK